MIVDVVERKVETMVLCVELELTPWLLLEVNGKARVAYVCHYDQWLSCVTV